MKLRARFKEININIKPEIVFALEKIPSKLEDLKGKIVNIELEEYKKERTLDANDYYWGLLRELNKEMNIGLNKLHLQMLREYGVGTYVGVNNEAVETFKSMIKYYYELERGDTKTQFLVLKGSSEMNTKEFWNLTNGVIQECENVGIPTLNKDDIYELMAERESKHS